VAIDRLGGKTCYHAPRAVLNHEVRSGEHEAVAARILLDSAFKLLRRCVISGVSRSVTIDSGRNKGREASSFQAIYRLCQKVCRLRLGLLVVIGLQIYF